MSQWICFLSSFVILVGMIGVMQGDCLTYRREAFALLVSTNRAMREPRWVGRATSTGSHAFYLKYIYIIVADSRESIGKRNKDL